jgi:hypothetical protein
MQRVTEYLVADHQRLHAAFEAATRGPEVDGQRYAEFRAGLLRHIAIEEKLLLPAARQARDGVPIERAHQLRIEHGAIGSLLVPTPDHALCAELASLLEAHDALEEAEDGVYAECERLIGPEVSQALLERARAFSEVRVAQHFDGPGTCRTAEEALVSAMRIVPPRIRIRTAGA